MKNALRLLTSFAVLPTLGAAAVVASSVPAQAQYGFYEDDEFRPRVERRIIERRVIRENDDDGDEEIIIRRRPPRVIERRIEVPVYGRPIYARPVYGRPFYGRPARVCRVVVTRRTNRFGEPVVVRRRICRWHDRPRCWLPERHLCR